MSDALCLFLGYMAGVITTLCLWIFSGGYRQEGEVRPFLGTPHPDNKKARIYANPSHKAAIEDDIARDKRRG